MVSSRKQSSGFPGRSTFQIIAAGVLLSLAAGLIADLVLWPRDQLPVVAQASQFRFFSADFIARAAAFRGPQSELAISAMAITILVPLVVAVFWPRPGAAGGRLARWRDRRSGALFGRGGPLGDAIVGGGVVLGALLLALPLQYTMMLRARDVGLVVQSKTGWLFDQLLGIALVVFAAVLLAVLCGWAIRRLGRGWWTVVGGVVVVLALGYQLLAPVLVEPLFADFRPAPSGQLRTEVEHIADDSGVNAGKILVVDAARRTTGANAYVAGLGSTKRVVIYDTLLRDFTPAEQRLVIAHEFGHARSRDLLAGTIWFGFVALLSLVAIDMIARALARRREVEFGSSATIAMVLAAATIAIAVNQPAANAYSRAVEARADAFALDLTREPGAAIALERRLTIQNVARPEPPAVSQLLFATHPTPMQRIGMAVTVRRELARPQASGD